METHHRIASVRVDGAKNTRKSFLGWLIQPHLKQDQTLAEVLHTTRAIGDTLTKTGIFNAIDAKLERSSNALAMEGDIDVVFRAREKGRFFAKTSTEVGNSEGNAVSDNFNSRYLLSL